MPVRVKLTPAGRAHLEALLSDTALTPVAPAPAPRAGGFVYHKRTDGFKPSEQQANFFEWVLHGKGSCLLEAVAGAGKTTTLIEALRLMEGSIFFGAYNKKIAKEIQEKAEKKRLTRNGLFISTMHGAGFKAWMRANPKATVNDRKVLNILRDAAKADASLKPYVVFAAKLVSFGKQMLIGIKSPVSDIDAWLDIVDHFGLQEALFEGADMGKALKLTMDAFLASAARCDREVDFDDMIFAPLYFNAFIFKNDWVLIDERQDTNPARRELAKRMLKTGGRLVAVGDTRQAIYGFTGADGDASKFIEEFGCVQLPLTTTYRCPKAVVAYAQQWVSHIQAHESAPEGIVRHMPFDSEVNGKKLPWYLTESLTAADAILCRYTRPLVQVAFSMLRAGIACKVEGRDIGLGLIKLAQRWDISTLDKLEERLETYLEHMLAVAAEEESEKKAQDVTDVVETLRIFIDRTRANGGHTIAALVNDIDAVFADDVSGVVTLCTGHKSKGREWPRVYWMQAPNRMVNLQDWEALQEDNVKYVIATRAMAELVLTPVPPKPGKK